MTRRKHDEIIRREKNASNKTENEQMKKTAKLEDTEDEGELV